MPPKSRTGKGKSPRKSSQGSQGSQGDMSKKKGRPVSDGKKKRKYNDRQFSRYIYKVLKQIHPEDVGISSKAMVVINDFMNDIFERIATEASQLGHAKRNHARQKTTMITSREIQAAVRLVVPGELAKHAVVEGTKAVEKYLQK